MKRVIRDRRLTPEEAAEYRAIRKEIDEEKLEISARIRKFRYMFFGILNH